MKQLVGFGAGVTTGALLAFFADPHGGHRRRSVLRGRTSASLKRAATTARRSRHSAANVLRGAVAETLLRRSREHVDDEVLVERVRAHMGHAVHHPRGVEVTASGRVVTLTGSIATDRRDQLIESVVGVPGVRSVVDRLTVDVASVAL